MLLVLVCVVAGFISVYSFLVSKFKDLAKIESLVKKCTPWIGLIAIFTGVWHFFSPSYMSNGSFFGSLDFVGDLIPSILAILVGVGLNKGIFNYINFSADKKKAEDIAKKIQSTVEQYRIFLGFATILFGILHLFDVIGKGYPFI